jgi:hypothetical protein
MNWGYKIMIVIFGFIMTMLGMVYIAFQQTNEMMDKNYYAKEIKYQSTIDAANNLNQVSRENIIFQNNGNVEIYIPRSLSSDFNDGFVEFIRNDNESKDIKMPFKTNENSTFELGKAKFSKGQYKARVSWKNSETNYYKEQIIDIK